MLKYRLRRALAMLALCAVLTGTLAAPASAAAFNDVPEGHWAADEISRCVEKGFFKGQAEGHFGLGESMTRSAFTVVLSRFFGWETPAPAVQTYPDVPVSAWYAGAVQAAFDHGALTRQAEEFRPADPITRQEMTVMLLRALGYSDLAGLSLELECPFLDVTENQGYITLAHRLGLMNGTTTTTFAPDRTATREQVAVIFMRLYDKLHSPAPEKLAMVPAGETVPDLTGVNAAAIPAGRLLVIGGTPEIRDAMDPDAAAQLRDAALQAGAKPLLHISASTGILTEKDMEAEAAAVLAEAVEAGGYEGLLLEIPRLRASYTTALTRLAAAVDEALGDRFFCLTAEAPAQAGTEFTGYDFPALAESADRLILRISPYEIRSGSVTMAPMEPLEEVYFALASLKDSVPAEKLSLLLTTESSHWHGSRAASAPMSSDRMAEQLAAGELTAHYSDRYACAYLAGATQDNASETVWYLNGRAAAERVQMLRLFGVGSVCLSDLHTVSPDLLGGLN